MNRSIERKITAGFCLTFLCIATQGLSGNFLATRGMALDRRVTQAQDTRLRLERAQPANTAEADAQAREVARRIAERDRFGARGGAFMGLMIGAELALLTLGGFGARGLLRRRQQEFQQLEAAERRAQELSSLQTAILDGANFAILSTDLGGRIQTLNATAERWLGYTEAEAAGKLTPVIFHDPQEIALRAEELSRELGSAIEPDFAALVTQARRGVSEEREWTYLRRDGSRFPALLSISAQRDAAGAVVGYIGIARDLTERHKNAEERETLAAIVENAHEFIATADMEGRLQFVNRSGRRMIGADETEDIRSRTIADISTEDSWRVSRDEMMPTVRAQGFWHGEGALRNRQTGAVIETLKTTFVIRHPQTGQPFRLASTQRDVTAQRQAQRALQESEERERQIVDTAAVGMKILAFDGTLLRVNAAFCAMLGYAPEEVIGKNYRELTFSEDHAACDAALSLLLAEEIPEASLEKRCLHRNGSLVHVMVKNALLRDWEGKPQSLSSQLINITERKLAEAALRRSQAALEEAQRVAQIGNWEFEVATGKVTWSKELFRLMGCDWALGEPDYAAAVACYHPADAGRLDAAFALALREGVPYALDLRGADAEGKPPRWFHTVGNPVFDGAGNVVRMAGILMDITERKRAEDALREAGDRLQLATEAGEMGVFDYDIVTNALTWDERMMRIFAFTPETFPGAYEAWSERLHPDDKAQAVADLEAAIASESKFETEFRIVLPDGSIRYIEAEAILGRDENGKPRRMIGQNKDVTERREAEKRLERLNRQNELLLESIGEGIYGIDMEGRATFVNPAAGAMLGCEPKELLGRNMHRLLHYAREDGTLYPITECPIHRALHSGEASRVRDEVFWRRDGSCFPVEYINTPIREEGRVVGVVVSFQDVTERRQHLRQIEAANAGLEANMRMVKEQAAELESQKAELEGANARLEALATTDGLTGIKNHRAFQQALSEEFARAGRSGKPLSLLLMDVDKFKSFNDTFGHPAGDKTLKAVARSLRDTARAGDFVARYGGEEFVVVLPDAGAAGALDAAERFRAAIEAHRWEERQVTVSVGVATLRPGAETPQSLIDCADKALYQAKQRGRNRAVHARDMWEEGGAQEVSKSIREALKTVLAAQNEELPFEIASIRDTMLEAYNATVESWSRIVDMKDRETEGHSERVTAWMALLARYVGMNADEAHFARWGVLLHDIGKIGVPDSILRKPGPLSDEEWVVMRRHPDIAREMLGGIAFLSPALEIPCCHHEKWDGTGYPLGLAGEEIPFAARLFAIIDVYDALTSDRPYRKGWRETEARAYLLEQSGTHFDPRAVNAFVAMLAERDGEIRKAA